MIYVLTHEYSDRSAFTICGVTSNVEVALAWFRAQDETNVYEFGSLNQPVEGWQDGKQGWREQERERLRPGRVGGTVQS